MDIMGGRSGVLVGVLISFRLERVGVVVSFGKWVWDMVFHGPNTHTSLKFLPPLSLSPQKKNRKRKAFDPNDGFFYRNSLVGFRRIMDVGVFVGGVLLKTELLAS